MGTVRPVLKAIPGPRIAAPGGIGQARARGEAFHVRGPRDLGVHGFLELVPWPLLDRPISRRRFVAAALALFATTAAALAGAPTWAIFAGMGAGVFCLYRELRSPERRARHLLRHAFELEIRAAEDRRERRALLDDALTLDPNNDAARLLRACHFLCDGDDVAALMQLAPLRDRHPDAGEILLLASVAYLHMGRRHDARRLLEAVEVDDAAAAQRSLLARLREACGLGDATNETSELPRWGSPLAEDLHRDR